MQVRNNDPGRVARIRQILCAGFGSACAGVAGALSGPYDGRAETAGFAASAGTDSGFAAGAFVIFGGCLSRQGQ